MENSIYFDNAASAIISPKAIDAARNCLEITANPSSLHSAGLHARKIITNARRSLAKSLGCGEAEVFFTSSATEANNMAIFSVRKGKIITTKAEHPSVTAPIKMLENNGFAVEYIPITQGLPDYDAFYNALDDNTTLVCFMLANNQSGALLELAKIAEIMAKKRSKAHFHCDAVQGYLKTNQNIAKYCHSASFSAHKLGGLKGIGAMYMRKDAKIKPLLFGGAQENSLRPGTENLVGIASFGAVVEEWREGRHNDKINQLRELFLAKIADFSDEIDVFIPQNHVNSIINLSFRNVRSEVALNALSAANVYISSSSACSSRAKTNTVLQACGLDKKYIDGAVRVAFSPYNTVEEVEILVDNIGKIAKKGT